MVRINSPLEEIGTLTSKYYRLHKVVADGILILDTYTEKLNKCINELDKKTKEAECQEIVRDLKSQNQSLLLNLSLIKSIKKKRLHLLKRYIPSSSFSQHPNKLVNIKLRLGLKSRNMESVVKDVSIKLMLKDYNFLRFNNKSIGLKLKLVDKDTGICKQVNLHIKFQYGLNDIAPK